MISLMLNGVIRLAEGGLVPDALIRRGIRALCASRLREIDADGAEGPAARAERFARQMRDWPIAAVPAKANEQHYELPPAFFARALGARRKYSSCFFPDGVDTLDAAEAAALRETCRHADLADGMRILELGCGWGSLTLWMAEQYPAAEITAVSNSGPQRSFIMQEAERRGLSNIRVITCDMNDFDIAERFDRIVSVEMFEHMRNYHHLLERISGWLKPDGRLFVHVFCHRSAPYAFETDGPANWMGRYFFTGGIMPSADLLEAFDEHMRVTERWCWDGRHYERTANAWLERMDRHRKEIDGIFDEVYGRDAGRWRQRWRIFFMACAELFGYDRGREWCVMHYLLEPTAAAVQPRETAAFAGAAS